MVLILVIQQPYPKRLSYWYTTTSTLWWQHYAGKNLCLWNELSKVRVNLEEIRNAATAVEDTCAILVQIFDGMNQSIEYGAATDEWTNRYSGWWSTREREEQVLRAHFNACHLYHTSFSWLFREPCPPPSSCTCDNARLFHFGMLWLTWVFHLYTSTRSKRRQ